MKMFLSKLNHYDIYDYSEDLIWRFSDAKIYTHKKRKRNSHCKRKWAVIKTEKETENGVHVKSKKKWET